MCLQCQKGTFGVLQELLMQELAAEEPVVPDKLTSMAAASAALGTTRNNRDLAGILSGSTGLSSSAWRRE